MEHELKAAADYARCSQIWQRVAPDLDPYPSDSPAPPPAAPSPPACPAMQLELLRRFIAGELESRCAFLRCARCAPSAAARRAMQLFAREEGAHARRLQSVHYLLTGSCFPPPAVQATAPLPWRAHALVRRPLRGPRLSPRGGGDGGRDARRHFPHTRGR